MNVGAYHLPNELVDTRRLFNGATVIGEFDSIRMNSFQVDLLNEGPSFFHSFPWNDEAN